MFKLSLIAALGIFSLSANAQNAFLLKGKITGKHDGQKVMLNYRGDGKMIQDSTIIKNGTFLLKGKTADAVRARIFLKDQVEDKGPMTREKMAAMDMQEFFLENKSYSIDGADLKTAQIKGGEAQTDYLLLTSQLKSLQEKTKASKTKVEDEFMLQHPDSYVTLDLLISRNVLVDVEKSGPAFQALSPRMKASAQGKKLAERLAIAMKTAIGKPAPNFVQNNTEGKPVSLASLKGKYVLVDFWASWCGPCRAENPNVLKAYHKYKDKNFEIIAVSLDDEKEPWLKAIEKDGLPWIHVSDLKGWNNSIASMYDVRAVPQNFLIGPDGVILAKNLRGEGLEKKLAELIKD